MNLAFCHSSEYDNDGIIRQNDNVTVSCNEGNTSAPQNLNAEHLDPQLFTSFSHTNPSTHLCSLNNDSDRCWKAREQKFKGIITTAGRGMGCSCPFLKTNLYFLSSIILYELLQENRK
jgi:hypothetical protein